MKPPYTFRQGEYLLFMEQYIALHKCAPSEAEMARHFQVAPPTVHQMVLTLEKRGLISRMPGEARSIRLKISLEKLPSKNFRDEFDAPGESNFEMGDALLFLGQNQIEDLFEHQEQCQLDDAIFIPLLDTVIESFASGGMPASGVKTLWDYACGFFHRRCQRTQPETTLQASKKLLFSYLAEPD